jgi:sugar lactone lactonase YvrE
MPGTRRWVRDLSFVVEDGSGLGTLTDPHGLYWAAQSVPGGPALFAADRGKGWVQKLSDSQSSTGEFFLDAGDNQALTGPIDVTVDRAGFIYVSDRGGRRALRYDSEGNFVQRVDVEPDSDQQVLVDPVALAADDSLVYVADRARGRVVRYERRK